MGEEKDKTELMVICDRFSQLMGVYNELNDRLDYTLVRLRGATPTAINKEPVNGLANCEPSSLDRLNSLASMLEIRNEKLRFIVGDFEKII
jgi:hypothetical protein